MSATHRCPGRCGQSVPNDLFACSACWQQLPASLQQPITGTAGLPMSDSARQAALVDAIKWYTAHRPWCDGDCAKGIDPDQCDGYWMVNSPSADALNFCSLGCMNSWLENELAGRR